MSNVTNQQGIEMDQIKTTLHKSIFCIGEEHRKVINNVIKELSTCSKNYNQVSGSIPNPCKENFVHCSMPYFDIVKLMIEQMEMAMMKFKEALKEKDQLIQKGQESMNKGLDDVELDRRNLKGKIQRKSYKKKDLSAMFNKKPEEEENEETKMRNDIDKQKRDNLVYIATIRHYKNELKDLQMITKDVKVNSIYETLVKLVEKHVETET